MVIKRMYVDRDKIPEITEITEEALVEELTQKWKHSWMVQDKPERLNVFVQGA